MNSGISGDLRFLRLLHVTTVPVTLRFLSGHIRHAKQRGIDVHALSSPGELLDEFARDEQVTVHPVAMPRRITPFGDLAALGRIVRVMRKTRPTIVDGHTPKGGLLAMLAATICRVPVRVYHMHGLPLMTATGWKRRVLRWTEKTACRLAHQVLCVSHSLRDVAIAEGLCPPEKIKVLGHGVIDGIEAENRFNPDIVSLEAARDIREAQGIPHDALVLGFVGRIVRDKGIIELVHAWRVLREKYPTLHLLMAGPFESQDPVPNDVEKTLREDARIHLAGDVREMPAFYRALDMLALPTYREGFPVVLLEAAAMALPVVATRIPGCVDAVCDGTTGALVPLHEVNSLATAIGQYLDDSGMRHRHGQNARARVLRDFHPDLLRSALFEETMRLLGEPSPVRGRLEGGMRCDQGGSEAPSMTTSNGYRRWVKRSLDILLSAAALLFLCPLLLILALLVRWRLGGPILFRQVRTGKGRQPFTILKFRTMTTECDSTGVLLPDARRLTRLGRFLRASSLDELPELWNVLKGDMSLVGPRPLLPQYDAYYSERELTRFDVLPGITGWAQINGRNDLPWDARLGCDAHYVETHGLLMDLKILVFTLVKVLRRDHVHADTTATETLLDEERRQRMDATAVCSGEAS